MNINLEVMFFIFGAFLVLTAILGGGFEVRELKIPTVSVVVRILSGVSGLVFVVIGIGLSPLPDPHQEAGQSTDPPAPTEAEGPVGVNGDTSFVAAYSELVQSSEGAYSYGTFTDASGLLQVTIPNEWTEINGEPYEDENGNVIFDIRASHDLASFEETWSTPGIIVRASADVTDEGISAFANRVAGYAEECEAEVGLPYDDGLYAGIYDVYSNCGGTGAMYIAITAMPDNESFVIGAEIQVVDDRDLDALDKMLESFQLVTDDVVDDA
jgi:hypothetical protein